MKKTRRRSRNPYQKAINIVTDFCIGEGITSEQLRTKPSSRTWNALRRKIAIQLREKTELSHSEIGDIIGRVNYRVPKQNSPE